MEKISFQAVMPHVFSGRTDLCSEVWGKDISFSKGHLYLVEADSGKGKSTFCSYIVGYRHDYDGSVLFDTTCAKTLSVDQWVNLRRAHISYLFQELRLFPELTAWENVAIKNNLTGFQKESVLKEWFERLGVADKLDAKIGHMSFGQQQRVAMIRVLAQPFDFVVVDEPISHLDDDNAAIMADIMMCEAHRQGAGVIVTSIGKHMKLDYEKTFKL